MDFALKHRRFQFPDAFHTFVRAFRNNGVSFIRPSYDRAAVIHKINNRVIIWNPIQWAATSTSRPPRTMFLVRSAHYSHAGRNVHYLLFHGASKFRETSLTRDRCNCCDSTMAHRIKHKSSSMFIKPRLIATRTVSNARMQILRTSYKDLCNYHICTVILNLFVLNFLKIYETIFLHFKNYAW